MTGPAIFRLVLLVLVAAAWAVLTWGVHKKLHARAEAAGTSAGAELGQWMRAPEDRKERNTFAFMTLVLGAMLVMQSLG